MKKLLLNSILLLCTLVVGTSSSWAEDILNETFNISGTDAVSSTYNGWSVTRCWGGEGSIRLGASSGDKGQLITPALSSLSGNATLTFEVKKYGTDTGSIGISVDSGAGTVSGDVTVASSAISADNWTSKTVTITGGSSTTKIKFLMTNKRMYLRNVRIVAGSTGGGSTVSTPTFNHGTDTYTTAQSIELSCATDDATIHYTLTEDGTTPADPTESDATYSSAISVTKSGTIIKAKAFKNGLTASSVAIATYTIQPAKPIFDVSTPITGKVYPGTQLVMSTAAGNTIIYTTDGTKPSYSEPNGVLYDSPITINAPITLKAIAVDNYGNESQQTIETYAIYYPGGVNIIPNYTFFGETDTFSGQSKDEVTGTTAEGIVVTYTRNGSNLYANSTAIRFYPSNTLKIDAPDGLIITNVVFTQSNGTADDMTSTPSGYNSTTKTWTGEASSVTFTRDGSSYLQFTNIEVVLAQKVTPAKTYTTLTSAYALDFTSVSSDLKAYIATEVAGNAVQMIQVNKVPAGTGLVLKATTPGTAVNVPVFDGTSPDDVSGNKMAGSATTTTAIAANAGYILSDGVFQPATAGTLAAGKAYLAIAVSGARALEMSFEDETTGVDDVRNKMSDGRSEYFNLAGQRVAQPTKGLYIVNGKKYVIK